MAKKEDITYDIIYLDKSLSRINVLYKTPIYTQGMIFTLDLPIENNAIPKDQALNDFIMSNAPIEQLTIQEDYVQWEKSRIDSSHQIDFSGIIVKNIERNVNPNQPTTNGTTVI